MSQPLNNFEQLLEEEASTFDYTKQKQAREGILGTLGSYKLVGQLVTVFIPDMVNVLIAAMGGDNADVSAIDAPTARRGQPPHLDQGPTDRGPDLPSGGIDLIR